MLRLIPWVLASAMTMFLGGGCAVTSSTGYLRGYPSDEKPEYTSYVVAMVGVPMFVYLPDDKVPKRARLSVSLRDRGRDKQVLSHQSRLRASPRDLNFFGSMRGDMFTLKTKDDATRKEWTLQFRKGADGMFLLVHREGDFLD